MDLNDPARLSLLLSGAHNSLGGVLSSLQYAMESGAEDLENVHQLVEVAYNLLEGRIDSQLASERTAPAATPSGTRRRTPRPYASKHGFYVDDEVQLRGRRGRLKRIVSEDKIMVEVEMRSGERVTCPDHELSRPS